jgi:hypothetical protein
VALRQGFLVSEEWREIPGFGGYEASGLGRVRSVDRKLSDGRLAGGVVLAATEDDNGYLRVTLSIDGRPVTKQVHVLVALAFKGRRPRGKEVRHLDGVKVNCQARNLAWGTKPQQEKDKKRHRRQKLSRVLLTRLGRM